MPGLALSLCIVITSALMRLGWISVCLAVPPLVLLAIVSKRIEGALIARDSEVVQVMYIMSGRGVSSRFIKLKARLFVLMMYIAVAVEAVGAGYALIQGVTPSLIALCVAPALPLVLMYMLVNIFMVFARASRKVAAEIEAPYFFILLRALASVKMPLHSIISAVESSVSLKAFSREFKVARRVSALGGLSLLSSLELLASRHPSHIVSEHFKRVIHAAVSLGDVSSAAERAFEAVYTGFEERLSKLSERLTIIVGSAIVVYLFVPIVAATVAPALGGNILQLSVASLSLQVLTFFLLYALISLHYPSSLAIKCNGKLLALSATLLLISIGAAALMVVLTLLRRPPSASLYVVLMAPLAVGAVVTERAYRRMLSYDKLVRAFVDSSSLASLTGESPFTVLNRIASKYGRQVAALAKKISTGYAIEPTRRAAAGVAPSVFHAAFIETSMYALLYGAKPEMVKAVVTSYEKLINLMSRVRALARSFETVILTLAPLIGGFLAYLGRIFKELAEVLSGVTPIGLNYQHLFMYSPEVHELLGSLVTLSLLLLSMLVGKMRAGSILFCFRTALISVALYMLLRALAPLV